MVFTIFSPIFWCFTRSANTISSTCVTCTINISARFLAIYSKIMIVNTFVTGIYTTSINITLIIWTIFTVLFTFWTIHCTIYANRASFISITFKAIFTNFITFSFAIRPIRIVIFTIIFGIITDTIIIT